MEFMSASGVADQVNPAAALIDRFIHECFGRADGHDVIRGAMKNQQWREWSIQMMQRSDGAQPLALIRVGPFDYKGNLEIHNRIEEDEGIRTMGWMG